MAGLYIHIPFCKQACHYCDFHFSTSREGRDDLISALSSELILQKKYLEDETIDTIYFGGGTPSLLSKSDLGKLLATVRENYVTASPEITLEANPDDLSRENLSTLRALGINRLSIGIQSFDNTILKFLNRAHTATEAFHCVEQAREEGFDNISIDLIYAIPGQDDNLLRKNIDSAVALAPQHISAYALTIEEKTVFGHQQRKGLFPKTTEEVAATQMEILMDELNRVGFDQYEISNFSKPGFHSRHNSSYWQQKKYLGIGPSAHSYNGTSRQHNIANNALYVQSINQAKIPMQLEILSRANKINEYIMTTLRTSWGCNLNYLTTQLDYDLLKEGRPTLDTLLKHRLIVVEDDFLKLTRQGKFLADKIASDLFVKE